MSDEVIHPFYSERPGNPMNWGSNWYPYKFTTPTIRITSNTEIFVIPSKTFTSAEQAMMYAKAVISDGQASIAADKIMEITQDVDIPDENSSTEMWDQWHNIQRKIKKLGGSSGPIENYNDAVWSSVRYVVVKAIIREKFQQNINLYDLLTLTTGILVEASPTDVIWGVGLSLTNPKIYDQTKWRGQNLLGKILMEIREELESPID